MIYAEYFTIFSQTFLLKHCYSIVIFAYNFMNTLCLLALAKKLVKGLCRRFFASDFSTLQNLLTLRKPFPKLIAEHSLHAEYTVSPKHFKVQSFQPTNITPTSERYSIAS